MATQIDPLPQYPNRNDEPSIFQALANAWNAALIPFRTQVNTVALEVEAAAAAADADAAIVLGARGEVLAARNEAVLAVNTPVWSSATNYGTGFVVKSPSNGQLYERIAPGGVNATDPSVDAASGTGTYWRTAPLYQTVVPPVMVSSSKTFGLNDLYRLQVHPSSDPTARLWTIPSNLVVPFAPSTVIPFINQIGAGVLTIGISTDTLRLLGTGATGARTVQSGGGGVLIKTTANEWYITGTGVT